ncbi:MAG: hypothetical protein IJD16_02855 [Desulfovibrio sp.]|nr:hypothetical protein [Desulfovibrio sp.]
MIIFRKPVLLTAVFGLCAALLAACLASGPQKTLEQMAVALQKKDSTAFLSHFDMQALAANDIKNLTTENQALSAMNSLGKELGLGSVDDLLGNLLGDRPKDLTASFAEGVSTGEIVAQCRVAKDAKCPWVPEALQKAEVKELGETAAVARVTTPAGVSSWLALQKRDGRWLVVGRSAAETAAVAYAQAGPALVQPAVPSEVAKPVPAEKAPEGKAAPEDAVTL